MIYFHGHRRESQENMAKVEFKMTLHASLLLVHLKIHWQAAILSLSEQSSELPPGNEQAK